MRKCLAAVCFLHQIYQQKTPHRGSLIARTSRALTKHFEIIKGRELKGGFARISAESGGGRSRPQLAIW